MRDLADVPLIEVCAGAGWGKTAAALFAARSAVERGERVFLVGGTAGSALSDPLWRTLGHVASQAAARGERCLYVLDDERISLAAMRRLLDHLEGIPHIRAVVTARTVHPLAAASRDRALLTATVGVEHLKFSGEDLIDFACLHGLDLSPRIATHVVGVFGGWPLALSYFISKYERALARGREISARRFDELVGATARSVLDRLLGPDRPRDLAIAALSDRIDGDVLRNAPSPAAWFETLERIDSLGLGGWGR